MPGNVDGGLVGSVLGETREGMDRTGQRCSTYALTEQLLRHLYGDGSRGEVRLSVVLDDCAWARYRAEVQRPGQPRPSIVVVPVPGVGAMEFRRANPVHVAVAEPCRHVHVEQSSMTRTTKCLDCGSVFTWIDLGAPA